MPGPPALSSAAKVRHYEQTEGLFAASRIDDASGEEVPVVFNTAPAPRGGNIALGYNATRFTTLAGQRPAAVTAPGSACFDLPAFGWTVCRVEKATP